MSVSKQIVASSFVSPTSFHSRRHFNVDIQRLVHCHLNCRLGQNLSLFMFLLLVSTFFLFPVKHGISQQKDGQKFYYWSGKVEKVFPNLKTNYTFFDLQDKIIHSPEGTTAFLVNNWTDNHDINPTVVLRTTSLNDIPLFLSYREHNEFKRQTFKGVLKQVSLNSNAEKDFYRARVLHYQSLLNRDGNQGGLYTGLYQEALADFNRLYDEPIPSTLRWRQQWWNQTNLLSFFTGNSALDENLALNQNLDAATLKQARTIDISTLPKVEVKPVDWHRLQKGKIPNLDPLSNQIPADQHAFFFRSFHRFRSIRDSIKNGFGVYSSIFDSNEFDSVISFYQNQLGIDFDFFKENHLPTFIQSVAITGSDMYYLEGTDLAILFECRDAHKVYNTLKERFETFSNAKTKFKNLDLGKYHGVGISSSDRTISRFLAIKGNSVILSNSKAQLKKILQVSEPGSPSLAELEEFHYFRTTYPTNHPESIFMFISDATIRRWCGPVWRITASRRTQARNVMTSLMTRQLLQQFGNNKIKPFRRSDSLVFPCEISETQIHSDEHGTLQFQTPIIELQAKKVSVSESQQYQTWLNGYQNNQWSNGFDPIGIRLTQQLDFHNKRNWSDIEIDIMVMPLRDRSIYNFIKMALKDDPKRKFDIVRFPNQIGFVAINHASEILTNMIDDLRSDFHDDDSVSFQICFSRLKDQKEIKESPEVFFRVHRPIDLKLAIENENEFGAEMYNGRPIFSGNFLDHCTILDSKTVYAAMEREYVTNRIDHWPLKKTYNPYNSQSWINQQKARFALGFFPKQLTSNTDLLWPYYFDYFQNIHSKQNLLNFWKKLKPGCDPQKEHYKYFNRTIHHPAGGKYAWNAKRNSYESSVFTISDFTNSTAFRNAIFGSYDALTATLDFPENGLRARIRFRTEDK